MIARVQNLVEDDINEDEHHQEILCDAELRIPDKHILWRTILEHLIEVRHAARLTATHRWAQRCKTKSATTKLLEPK